MVVSRSPVDCTVLYIKVVDQPNIIKPAVRCNQCGHPCISCVFIISNKMNQITIL